MAIHASEYPAGIEIRGAVKAAYEPVLTPATLEFIAELTRRFGDRVTTLLAAREARQAEIDSGKLPDFLPETRSIRESEWQVAKIPEDLWDRRVEITGPTDRKMIINALNSGAKVFMADCEDSLSPTLRRQQALPWTPSRRGGSATKRSRSRCPRWARGSPRNPP